MPVMLGGERLSQRPASEAVTLTPFVPVQAARATDMLGTLAPGQLKLDSYGVPEVPHTQFSTKGVLYSSNGETTRGVVVANAIPLTPLRQDGTHQPDFIPEPFGVRSHPTQSGLVVAELDRTELVPIGDFVGATHLLDRGAILVASPIPEQIENNQLGEPLPLRINNRPRQDIPNKKDVHKERSDRRRRYPLTTLDALIAHADSYMREMNANGPEGSSSETTISQRMAISHVLASLSSPDPISEVTVNRRLAVGIPPNVDPETLYHQFALESTPVHSEVTDVTYSHTSTIHGIDKWIIKRLAEGANRDGTFFEAVIRAMEARWQAQAELRRGEHAYEEELVSSLLKQVFPPQRPTERPIPRATFFKSSDPEQVKENLAHFRQERKLRRATWEKVNL